jgi:hypothetical protein
MLILEELLTITVQTFFWFVDIGGIVDPKESLNSNGLQFYQYHQTKKRF